MSERLAAGRARGHVISELGLVAALAGDELHGTASVVSEMHVPGTDCLRTSILAAWADILTGILSTGVVAPRVPVTVDLAVELERLPRACAQIIGRSRILKTGRSAVVAEVEFDADGEPLAIASAAFMPTPDPAAQLPSMVETLSVHAASRGRLTMPFAQRAGCDRRAPGVATLGRSKDGLNAANTINGGLIALAVEEAVLSALPPAMLTSLAIRYLRPARIGPIVATADIRGALARVEVRDSGSDDRLVVVATARIAELPPAGG